MLLGRDEHRCPLAILELLGHARNGLTRCNMRPIVRGTTRGGLFFAAVFELRRQLGLN